MATTAKQRARQLEDILNAVERGNKKDALDFTRGHLNESNLRKPKQFTAHKGWDASKSKKPLAKEGGNTSKLPRPQQVRNDGMKEALAQFTLGTDGFLPTVRPPNGKVRHRNEWPAEVTGSVDENALVEEIDSKRFMLNRSQPTRLTRRWAVEDENNDAERTKQSKSVPLSQHEFYSMNLGATKRDQFNDFKSFEHDVLRKQDMLDKSALAGSQAAAKLEQKLNRKLMILGHGSSTAYHRLQAHSETLQELLESSPVFGYLLKQIKSELDDYVEWLLVTQPTQSNLLREQIDDLYDKRVSNPKQLNHSKQELNRLEEEGRQLLELNDRLRGEVKHEKDGAASNAQTTDYYPNRQMLNKNDKSQFDLADQLQDLHATVLEKMDKLEQMRANMRQEYVPNSVCQNLEQCLKDTGVEVQKLLKQNEILSKDIDEMEEGIGKAVDECDASDRDKNKCWKKVNRTRVSGIRRTFAAYDEYAAFVSEHADQLPTNLSHPYQDGGDSSEDEDENQTEKWNWYIS